jgi:hypothetical protein
MKIIISRCFALAALALLAVSVSACRSTPNRAAKLVSALGESSGENLTNLVQLYRSEFSAIKIKAISDVLKLSEAEANSFWPIYREYGVELARLSDTRVMEMRQFVLAYRAGQFDDAKAKEIADGWFQGQADRLALWKRYYGRIEASLGSIRANQFLQAEYQIALMVDLAIAQKLPVIREK